MACAEPDTLARALEDLGAPTGSPFEQLGTSIVLTDVEGRIRWQNSLSVARVGDQRGRNFLDLMAPEHREMAQTEFTRLRFNPQASSRREVVVIGPDGRRKRTMAFSVPVRGEDGVVGILTVGVPLNWHDDSAGTPELSPRLLDTLELLTAGRSTREIAAELGISVETARNHIRRLLKALGVHSRVEAVAKGKDLRLLTDLPRST
jgi:DNA-binding CsgD family transcriptional regulator